MDAKQPRLRLDKWLWTARFFKTRSLAAAAIDSGKVLLNQLHVKPAKEVHPGDTLDIVSGEQQLKVIVEGINEQRRPASEARQLYTETPESLIKRQKLQELRRLAPAPGSDLRGRPTKKAGRLIRRFSSPD
ncbi:MAG: S4 domain-containing protein [Sterolibacterium sp.]